MLMDAQGQSPIPNELEISFHRFHLYLRAPIVIVEVDANNKEDLERV